MLASAAQTARATVVERACIVWQMICGTGRGDRETAAAGLVAGVGKGAVHVCRRDGRFERPVEQWTGLFAVDRGIDQLEKVGMLCSIQARWHVGHGGRVVHTRRG